MKLTKGKISFKLALTVLMIASCSRNSKVETIFEIINSTNQVVDSLTIQPDEDGSNHMVIQPNGKAILKTDMTNMPKVDGSYYLGFKSKETFRGLNFGYYSNGYPLESITRIRIEADTIIIKQEYRRSYE